MRRVRTRAGPPREFALTERWRERARGRRRRRGRRCERGLVECHLELDGDRRGVDVDGRRVVAAEGLVETENSRAPERPALTQRRLNTRQRVFLSSCRRRGNACRLKIEEEKKSLSSRARFKKVFDTRTRELRGGEAAFSEETKTKTKRCGHVLRRRAARSSSMMSKTMLCAGCSGGTSSSTSTMTRPSSQSRSA